MPIHRVVRKLERSVGPPDREVNATFFSQDGCEIAFAGTWPTFASVVQSRTAGGQPVVAFTPARFTAPRLSDSSVYRTTQVTLEGLDAEAGRAVLERVIRPLMVAYIYQEEAPSWALHVPLFLSPLTRGRNFYRVRSSKVDFRRMYWHFLQLVCRVAELPPDYFSPSMTRLSHLRKLLVVGRGGHLCEEGAGLNLHEAFVATLAQPEAAASAHYGRGIPRARRASCS
jgi:hypothetical protein